MGEDRRMEKIKKYLKENYVAKKDIEDLVEELYQEFHRLDEEIEVYNRKPDDKYKVDMMQEISWLVGKLETLIGKE